MDSFDVETVEKYVKQYKRKIVNKLETFNINEKDLKSHADLLCMVLEYSPRAIDERKVNEKYLIKTVSPEIYSKAKTRTYLLEKQVSSGSESSDEEKDMKSSKFSSKFDSNNTQINNAKNKNGENPYRYSLISKMSVEIKTFVRNVLNEIILNVFNNSSKFKEEIKLIEEEEEDDFFDYAAIDRRRLTKNNTRKDSEIDFSSHEKKKSHTRFGDNFKIRVFLFKTKNYLDVSLFINETIYDLKNKIIERLQKEQNVNEKYKLSYLKPEALEIRMIDDDDDFLPNLDFPALDDKLNIFKSGNKILSIIEKKEYDPNKEKPQLLGPHTKNNELRVVIRIYLVYENEKNERTVIEESGEKTLKNVLESLVVKKKLPFKNFEYFYFVEHHEANKNTVENNENETIDNEINLDTQLKYLNFFELDLNFKKFQDAPESIPLSLMSDYIQELSRPSSQQIKNNTNYKEEVGREYIFNDITAGVYQVIFKVNKEFEVIKINPYKSKQERVLGIDRYNITNNMPKSKIQASIMNFFYGGTKRPLRKTKDVIDCDYLNNKSFFISLNNEGIAKKVIYQVKNVNVRNEIVAKLKYIMKMNQVLDENK